VADARVTVEVVWAIAGIPPLTHNKLVRSKPNKSANPDLSINCLCTVILYLILLNTVLHKTVLHQQ
jgi:hypothetical protein